MSTRPQLAGRSSSHFTRVARIFAHELAVDLELVPVHDITATDALVFAGNPALKIPSLRIGERLLFGSENICRALAELSTSGTRPVWPEQLGSDLSRNAQELVEHTMAAQVQWVIGTMVAKLPAENVYFAKGRAGLEGALRWLDAHLAQALGALPSGRGLSLFEVQLFCLLEHLVFRGTVPLADSPALRAFSEEFAKRPSAQATAYRFDPPPA